MSESDLVDNESGSDHDCEETEDETKPNKALPWHSMDLVKRDGKPEIEDVSDSSSDSESVESVQTRNINPNKALKEEEIARNIAALEIERKPLHDENKQPFKPPPPRGPATEINLLLLGESGVGKSTFINSFANYMKHANFEAVQENNLSVLIPARFHIFDKDFKKHLIEIGANDDNEHLADGVAATQDVKTYVFNIVLDEKVYKIRLVDTPGIGDSRGIDQDNKNCDYVLNYLGRLDKIHAICLLLKPTNTRLDVFLNYCVTQILSRLEKSATQNIAFLFTNTRGQNYTPGDTYTSLELLVKKIKDTNNVSLPLSHKNVFCFDNEAFRFLASMKDGVEFREGILEANIESWKYSYKEVYRLLSYIVQLNPHDPQKTISINHARKMVMQLSQPLAEIVQLIGDNIYQLDQHTDQLLMENQTLEQLKQKLHMPVVDIRVKELSQPVTVCTAPNCSTIYKVADKNKYHYKQRCHNPCYLNNVPAEIVGDPNILQCWAITKSTQTCHQCGCRFNTHMHIYYETDTYDTKIVDQNVLKNITSKEDAAKQKQILINDILNHKEQLEKEHRYIIKCSAAFAHFLQQNAITPINDSLREYVKYLISREENLGDQADRATLTYLRRLLNEYEQEKNVLEEALKHNTSGVVNSSPTMIENKIRELFTLPNFGKKIKQLYDLHQSGGITEHKQSEYIVEEQYTLSLVDRVKSFGNSVLGAIGFKKTRRQETKQKALEFQSLEQEYQQKFLELQQLHGRLSFNGPFPNGNYFGPNTSTGHYDNWNINGGYYQDNYNPVVPFNNNHQVDQRFVMEYQTTGDDCRDYEPNGNNFGMHQTSGGNRSISFNQRRQYFEQTSNSSRHTRGGEERAVAKMKPSNKGDHSQHGYPPSHPFKAGPSKPIANNQTGDNVAETAVAIKKNNKKNKKNKKKK